MSTITPTEEKPLLTHRQILFIILGLMSGMFLASLDQTIVGTSIRTIADDLKGLSLQAWVTTAYLITSTISTPILGKLSDIFGRRRVFLFAITIFILGSAASSFAWSMYSLAGFRAIQGIGAGGLMSLALTIMGDILSPRERAKYQGYFLAVFGTSSVLGPLVGGLFSGADQILGITGWRWVFLINVPIGIVSLFLVTRFLHLPKGFTSRVKIDWFGAAFVILALVPGLIVAEQGRTWGWDSWGAILCYVLTVVGIIAFIITETIMKESALIPMTLFKNKTFAMATVLSVLVGFAMFGALLTIPLYLQLVGGYTPTESGLQLIPMIVGLMTASIVSGQLISRTGKYRIFPITGTLFLGAGFFYFTFVTPDRPFWWAWGGMLLLGLGLGQLMQTLTIASQNAVEPRYMAVATSGSTFFRQIGGTLGTAILFSVLFNRLPDTIATAFKDKGLLRKGLDAALNPAVANADKNRGIMGAIWNKIVDPIKANLEAGGVPSSALADSKVRGNLIDNVLKSMTGGSTSSGSGLGGSLDGSTSYLNGATQALKEQLLYGFTNAMITVFWVSLIVVAVAFVLALFFKAPPLRDKSALQHAAEAANNGAAMIEPGVDTATLPLGTRSTPEEQARGL